MSKNIVILQTAYLPWKGFFDQIHLSDVFVIYDEMQFVKRKWQNRNLIKTQHGLQWLTVPVNVKGRYFQKLNETTVRDADWAEKHWETIRHAYKRAPHFSLYETEIRDLFEKGRAFERISDINIHFITSLANILGISTQFRRDTDYDFIGDKSERLLNICKQAGATCYISGPSAKDYLDQDLFDEAKIKVHWINYENYREYPQLYPPFEHRVSILDLLFNTGKDARNYLKTT